MILLTFLRALHDVYVETQALRADAHKRYPSMSDWD